MTIVTTSIVITTTSQRKATVWKRERDQIWTESDPGAEFGCACYGDGSA